MTGALALLTGMGAPGRARAGDVLKLATLATAIDRTADERAKWDALFKQVRSKLGQGTFVPELITKLEQLGQ